MAPSPARPRPALVAGNWKMHRGGPDGADLARAVVKELGGRAPEGVEVALLPPFPALAAVGRALEGTGILLGAQACHPEPSGAFTGEVSAEILAAWGCSFVLCGHSERRRLAGERDSMVQDRVGAALRAGLRPILCVGETLEEREQGRPASVVNMQVAAGTMNLGPAEASRVVVAYEPVWAIGTGRNATPEQAAEGHGWARGGIVCSLAALNPEAEAERVSEEVRVIYGGSVNPGNAEALLTAPGVDGALVGGASLDAAGFAAIVRAAAAAPAGAARGGS